MIKSWSPSRLDKYDTCPQRFKWGEIEKKCGKCFKGRMMGEWGEPQTCDACGVVEELPAPIVRGNVIDANITAYIRGETKKLLPECSRHPKVLEEIKLLKKLFVKDAVKVQHSIVLDAGWKVVSKFTRGAWFRGTLDVLCFNGSGTEAQVIDWKSGGIDKRDGSIRADKKYDDQLFAYTTAVLTAFPQVEYVTASLVFVDCGPRFDPIINKPEFDLRRRDLAEAQRTWEKRLRPMFADRSFLPTPGTESCRFCPYKKEEGGPCKF